jgi:F0F1-type ATP synthase epsilon subunit
MIHHSGEYLEKSLRQLTELKLKYTDFHYDNKVYAVQGCSTLVVYLKQSVHQCPAVYVSAGFLHEQEKELKDMAIDACNIAKGNIELKKRELERIREHVKSYEKSQSNIDY